MTADIELISVDVWDTILRRRCHPDTVKYHVANTLLLAVGRERLKQGYRDLESLMRARCRAEATVGTRFLEQGFDDEYRLVEVYDTWLEEVMTHAPRDTQLHGALEVAELSFEAWSTYLDPSIIALLSSYPRAKIVLASDFYLPAGPLLQLVRRAGFSLPIERVYVSCDHRLNKRSGRLFERIASDYPLAAGRHLHVGDNPVSDVAAAERLGIRTLLYKGDHVAESRERGEAWFRRRASAAGFDKMTAEVRRSTPAPSFAARAANDAFDAGRRSAMLHVAFVMSVIEDAIQRGAKVVHYFTREGVFFRQIHEAIAANNPFSMAVPASELLEVSRLATFGASASDLQMPSLMRLWSQYSTQSIGALLTSLDLDASDYHTFLERHRLSPKDEIAHPWNDQRVQALLADPGFRTRASRDLSVKRRRLYDYFASKGLDERTSQMFVVDIGWRGTIQDNIAHLFPRAELHGYYFGLFPFLNAQLPGVTKRGVYFDANIGEHEELCRIFSFASVVEMLANSNTGSVVRYERSSAGVAPSVHHEPAEDRVFEKFTRYYQAGVLSMVPGLCAQLRLEPYDSTVMLAAGRRALVDVVTNPPRVLADAFFSLAHNETFGVGGFVSRKPSLPLAAVLGVAKGSANGKRVVHELNATGWPQGALKVHNLDPLIRLYNARIIHPHQPPSSTLEDDDATDIPEVKAAGWSAELASIVLEAAKTSGRTLVRRSFDAVAAVTLSKSKYRKLRRDPEAFFRDAPHPLIRSFAASYREPKD